jgi:hypothetical protein
LVVLYHGVAVYDQTFHDGVNVIRGRNSSGKSTILDFIFYALGGDFTGWKPEAESCQSVQAEVEINNAILTVRRGVTNSKGQPMEIFWGSLDDAARSPFEGWEIHPFRRTDNKASFSQVLFKALKLPEVRNEQTANLTMHQLLRLICVDQLSNVNSLLRDEQWDSPTTRKAVGDLLYGLYDDQLYADELELRNAERDLERAKNEHGSLQNALLETGQMVDLAAIDQQLNETNTQLELVRNGINDAQGSYEIPNAPEDSAELQRVEAEIRKAKIDYAEAARQREALDMEVEDSEEFIDNLQQRLKSLEESIAAEKALGRLTLHLCPECLQPLDVEHIEGHCFLCKKPAPPDGYQKQIARLRSELSAQIHESEVLLGKKRASAAQKAQQTNSALSLLTPLERRFTELVARSRSRRDAHLDEILEKKGSLEGRLNFLDSQRKLATRLQDTHKRIGSLELKIEILRRRIRDARSRQDARRIEAENCINRYATEFLKRDLAREELFGVAQRVNVDFERNLCLVDGRSSFSASSISYLKAAVHFSLLFASLELNFFRYPKLVVNDNIEDKGMEEERSQNLQRVVLELSKQAKVRHQIILATSMVDSTLEAAEFCIGPAYTLQNKTLQFPNRPSTAV